MATVSTGALDREMDGARTDPRNRLVLTGVAVVLGVLTLGLAFREAWATWLWPWSDVRMTFIFLASIVAAAAGSIAWAAWEHDPAAIAGIALDAAAVGGLAAPALAVMGIRRDDSILALYALGSALLAIVAWLVFRRWHSVAPRDAQPIPLPARIAFGAFIALLLIVGGALLLRADAIFPWDLQSATSTMVGVMFVGAASYFAYGLWRNCWTHGGGQLAGFLAYDIVLAIPYLRMIGDDDSGGMYGSYGAYSSYGSGGEVNGTSLAIYLTVLGTSATIAIYYLFLHRSTRVWSHDAG